MILQQTFRTFSYRSYHVGSSSQRNLATIVSGTNLARLLLDDLRIQVESLKFPVRPRLVPILVGHSAQSLVYIEKKREAAKRVGIDVDVFQVPDSITESELLSVIRSHNDNDTVHGIIVQLPLPAHISETVVCNAVCPTKDVDGFTSTSLGNVVQSLRHTPFIPCTALAVINILRSIPRSFMGANAVVIGRSHNVGLPIALALQGDKLRGGFDMTTTICHRNTHPSDLAAYTRFSDVIVSAAGVPNLIRGDMIKPGACVIDVGLTRVQAKNGKVKLMGDVNREEAQHVAGWLTPVPGGVGPCTVACLLQNTVHAAALMWQHHV